MPEKMNPHKLAPDIIGGIIQNIEEQPIPNTDWIQSINISKNNIWTVYLKPKASYYPKSILKYNHFTKSKILHGSLFQIEDTIYKIWNNLTYKNQ